MRRRRFLERQRSGPGGLDRGVHDIEHRLGRAETGRDGEVAELSGGLRFGQVFGAAAEHRTSLVESRRVGPLEAVNGLLEIADHEERARAPLGLARAAEIFIDQPLDDLPLRGVGVLRFVDQHVVDLAVELVAHPLAHAGFAQQATSPFDKVVEVGDSGRALGLRVGRRECLPGAQPRGDVRGKPGAALHAQQLGDAFRQPLRVALIVGISLDLAGLRFA